MANSKFDILEYRCVIDGPLTHIYIRISDANAFKPIGGWYKKTLTEDDAPSLPALEHAFTNQSYLIDDDWTRESPDAPEKPKFIDDIIDLLEKYWTFDHYQHHSHSWHDKQFCLETIRDMKGR